MAGTRAKTTPSQVSEAPSDPKYISYLLNTGRMFDCWLIVGNSDISPTEKIGVVSEMLFAHSEVMRTDLQMKNMKERKPIGITDIFPNTFRNLLRYVYGFDTVAWLSFDEADNLLYVAEKYMITELKNKLAKRLLGLLNYDNVCILMNNPACFQHLQLKNNIDWILESETARVFSSPHFLELTNDAFVKILEKDVLKMEEIEIWRKAVQWAKHQGKKRDGKNLRKKLEKPLKHLRLCTVPAEEFSREVVRTEILTEQEVEQVQRSRATQRECPDLTEVCNTLEVRSLEYEEIRQIHLIFDRNKKRGIQYCSFGLQIRHSDVELKSFEVSESDVYFKVKVSKAYKSGGVLFAGTSNEKNVLSCTGARKVLLQANTQYLITATAYCEQTVAAQRLSTASHLKNWYPDFSIVPDYANEPNQWVFFRGINYTVV